MQIARRKELIAARNDQWHDSDGCAVDAEDEDVWLSVVAEDLQPRRHPAVVQQDVLHGAPPLHLVPLRSDSRQLRQ